MVVVDQIHVNLVDQVVDQVVLVLLLAQLQIQEEDKVVVLLVVEAVQV